MSRTDLQRADSRDQELNRELMKMTAKYMRKYTDPRSFRYVFRRRFRDNLCGVTRLAIRRLARRGGLAKIQVGVYETTRQTVLKRVQDIVWELIQLKEERNGPPRFRKTVTSGDVVKAIDRLGHGQDRGPPAFC